MELWRKKAKVDPTNVLSLFRTGGNFDQCLEVSSSLLSVVPWQQKSLLQCTKFST